MTANTLMLADYGARVETALWTGAAAEKNIVTSQSLELGGMVHCLGRSIVTNKYMFDTERGVGRFISSDANTDQQTDNTTLTAFLNNGFTLGANTNLNALGETYAAWCYKKSKNEAINCQILIF